MPIKIKSLLFIVFMVWIAGVSVSEAKTYIIGVENIDYYPHYTSTGDQYKGYARDVFDAFAKQSGNVFEYKILPVKRLFNVFLEGGVDFKYPDNPDWQKDLKKGKTVQYSNAIADYVDGVMVLPVNKGAGMDKLHVLGTVRGFTAWDYMDTIKVGKVKLQENNTFQGLLQQVILDRADGAYVNVAVANYQLSDVLKKPGGLVFDPKLPHTRNSYFCSTIKYPEIIQELNTFLTKHKSVIDGLKKKYNLRTIE